MKYTKEQIKELEIKANKWDMLGKEIEKLYIRPDGTLIEQGDEDYDEEGLLPIGESAAYAYGWM